MTTPSIEDVKAYWDARPCNVRHSNKEVGTKEYFDEVQTRKYLVEPHIPGFAEFPKWAGKRVLEIGCGIGTDAVSFAQAGADYTGIDISDRSIELARMRFKVYGLKGTFYVGNAEELSQIVPAPPYDHYFDLVYAFGSIHHCPHPQRVVREVIKYMCPRSEFRLMLYAKPSWKQIMIDFGLEQPEAQPGCPIARTYTRQQAVELLIEFRIKEIRQDHIFPYDVEKYKRYEYQLLPHFEAMPQEVFNALRYSLGWHMLIRCTL